MRTEEIVWLVILGLIVFPVFGCFGYVLIRPGRLEAFRKLVLSMHGPIKVEPEPGPKPRRAAING